MSPRAARETVTIENARLIYLNFKGEERQFNRPGDRNFCVLLEDDIAEVLAKNGWNIKTTKAREEGDEERPYIQVSVSYKVRPPMIYMVTSRGRTLLGEELVGMLDDSDIIEVDLIMTPYDWDINGRTGRKAYVKTMFVTIDEDELMQKYADVPDASGR